MRASILGENNPVLPILAISRSISVNFVHAPDTTKLTMQRNSRHMFQQLKYLTLWRFSPRFTYLVSVLKKNNPTTVILRPATLNAEDGSLKFSRARLLSKDIMSFVFKETFETER